MSMTPVMKRYRFSMRMVEALMSGDSADGAQGRTGTLVALIDRQLITPKTQATGSRHLLTDKGREVIAELRAAAQPEKKAVEGAVIVTSGSEGADMAEATALYRDDYDAEQSAAYAAESAEFIAKFKAEIAAEKSEAASPVELVVQPEMTTTTRTTYRPQFSVDGGYHWSNIMMLGEVTASDARRECEYQVKHGPKGRIFRVLTETMIATVEMVPAAPETADDGPRYEVRPNGTRFTVYDTATGREGISSHSRYAAQDHADRRNREEG
ncbi:hypothetical protein ACIF6L_26390 [Kitasatospora sp. NPDC086009]|uniref:hypothetical protein n=1 Tax=unclassified Kitasatospora TaxID=2633591 RepID=UPI0037C5C447